MSYEEFKEVLVEQLQELYGEQVIVKMEKVVKTNDQSYDGLQIIDNPRSKINPIVRLELLYEMYLEKGLTMEECVEWIQRLKDEDKGSAMMEFVQSLRVWDNVKEDVYPMLVFNKKNQEYLETMVSTPMLDLSIIYAVRRKVGSNDEYSLKVTKDMLNEYKITKEELHQRAMENIGKEMYQFTSMDWFKRALLKFVTPGNKELNLLKGPEMYVLTTNRMMLGTAVILDKKLFRELVGTRNYYLIMSCIHEIVLIPDDEAVDREYLNEVISEIYENAVDEEERLSPHYYYYNGATGEITMDDKRIQSNSL